MKKQIKQPGITALMALIVIMTACNNGMVEKPSFFILQTPTIADFNISGHSAIADGSPQEVNITPKADKSQGTITIHYEGTDGTVYAKSTTAPSAVGKYTVTFDVAAAVGFYAVSGLRAGTLVISVQTPNAVDPTEADFNISGHSAIADGSPKEVSITPKADKSQGSITIYYEGTDSTVYTKSTVAPSEAGSYTVTFDVAAALGFNAAEGLSAGTLVISEQTPNTVDPTEADFNISGHSAIADGNPKEISITPKADKSQGAITIHYEGTDSTVYTRSTVAPSEAGSYAVTFDVAAALGFNAAEGLSAGTLVISVQTPNAVDPTEADFDISGHSAIADGSPKEVSITPKADKSQGTITIHYEGTDSTVYTKSTTAPSAVGKYTVTFDITAAEGFNARTGLNAGTLVISVQIANAVDPVEADFIVTGLSAVADGSLKEVSVMPKEGKSQGTITVYYEGTDSTVYTKSTVAPSLAGKYAVTFDVAAASGFNAVTGLNAGILIITSSSGIPSSNANIRAVSGDGTNALYGLYIAGSPGISNGDPQADVSGFETHTSTIWGNYTLSDPANNRSIVVIVEDKKVSKVEFGITGNAAAAPTSATAPNSWVDLTKNNDYTTTDTDGKRWTGTLTSPDRPSSSSYREVYVRITAEDNTVQVYRYVQYVSSTAPGNNTAARGELNALTIGGVSVVTNAKDVGTNKRGSYAGWWNKTVAPEIEPGEVTLTTAQAATGSVSATFYYNNEQAGSTVSYAKISSANWPLKESAVTFTDLTTTTTSNIAATGTISGITNGDYIILRRNPPSSATYSGYYGHYIIKIIVEDSYTVTFNKNGGTTDASPASIKVTSPAATVGILPTAPTRTGHSFTGWNTEINGSGSAFTATTPVTADIPVYAQWSPYTLSISYDGGGGTGPTPTNATTSAAYGTNVTMPANPYTRDGFNFAGWAVSGEGSITGTYQVGAGVAVSALSTAIAAGNASITLTATWSDAPVTLSSNANIRAVSGTGATALYGLYVGGMPGIDNGTPRSTADGFSTAASITLSGNSPTNNPDRKVVVIVEDKKVSKVEFGVNATANSTTAPGNTPPSTWYTLTRDNNEEFITPDTVDRRWVGPLTVAALTSSSGRGFYVKITAEDGTTLVYRYWQYISTSSTNTSTPANGATRGELTALSIGGVTVISTSGSGSSINVNVASGQSKGLAQGWWNKTVAPDLSPGEVTITAAQAASCAVSATVNNGDSCSLSLAKISASQWPLKEDSVLTFTTTGSTANNATVSGNFTNVADGDYIIIRQNASTAANYKALFSHYIIKVNVK